MGSLQGNNVVQLCISHLEQVEIDYQTPRDVIPFIQQAKAMLQQYITPPSYDGSSHSDKQWPPR